MVRGVKHFRTMIHYSMYADDVKLCGAIVDEMDMETMQETLEVVFKWAESHGMKFSTGKTKCLSIGRETIIGNYKGAEGETLEWEDSLKDLGVMVSSDGTMIPTVEEVIRKVQKTSWWIIRTFRNRTPAFWKFVWLTYIGPQYEYCGPLYYPST